MEVDPIRLERINVCVVLLLWLSVRLSSGRYLCALTVGSNPMVDLAEPYLCDDSGLVNLVFAVYILPHGVKQI